MYILASTACIINIPISIIIFSNATESISLTFRSGLTEYLTVTRHVAIGVHTLHVKAVSFIIIIFLCNCTSGT